MQFSENISEKGFYRESAALNRTKALGFTESLFLLYIFILPLESSEYLVFYIEFVHISAVDLLLAAILYIVLLKRINSRSRISFLPLRFVLIFMLVIVSSAISLFYVTWDEDMAYDLKKTLNLLEYLAIFYVTTSLVRDTDALKRALYTFCLSLFAFSVLTVLKSIGFDLPGYQRGNLTYIGPFNVGMVAIFNSILPISLLTLGTFPAVISGIVFKRSWVRVPLILTYLTAALLTYTRSLWIALILQVLLYFYFTFYTKRGVIKKILFLVFMPAIIFLVYGYHTEIFLFIEGIRPSTVHSRLYGYRIALDMVTSKFHYLLFGSGEGSFIQSYAWYTGEETVVHNFILDMLVSKGLITLLLILSVIVMITYNLFKIKRIDSPYINSYSLLFILSIFGMIVQGMMSPIINSLIFWTYLALAYSLILIVQRRMQSSKSYT